MTLDVAEFIRRFLLHTLPPGFQRIRHYGLLSNQHRRQALTLCRQLLATPATELLPNPRRDWRELYLTLTRHQLNRCPHCGIGVMLVIETLPAHPYPALLRQDTS